MKLFFDLDKLAAGKGAITFLRLILILMLGTAVLLGGNVPVGASVQEPDSSENAAVAVKVYLPIVLMDVNYTISGQILDQNLRPVSGVIVTASNSSSAVSGGDGTYVIAGLKPGSYTVSPQNSNRYYFEPGSRSVALTDSMTGVNFSAIYSGGQYINNSGFEDNSAWEISSTAIQAGYTTRLSHSGARSMQAGIFGSTANASGQSKFRQSVPIPNSLTGAHLTFWMYPTSSDTFIMDGQSVYLIDSSNGKTLEYLINNQRRNDNAWVSYQFDLTKYAGKYIEVVFSVNNDGVGGITGMLIDDVALIITP